MSIRITTLGRLQVTRGDSVITALPAQRLRCALLVYLAVTRETTRDRLLATFWPERSDSRARHALSQNIYELRSVLGEDWVAIRGEQVVVAGHVTIDLLAFGEAADREDAQAALSLYRGSFLDGFTLNDAPAFDSWVDGQRLRAQRQHRKARREWITKLSDQARIRDALLAAREWVAIDPQDDEAQHRLIELLAETGDRAGAIRQFEAYERQLLADELTPLDDTRQLVERIRGGEVGTLPSPPVSMSAARPSAHSLRVDMPPAPAEPAAVTAAPAAVPATTSPADRLVIRRTLVACSVILLLGLVGFFSTRPEPLAAGAQRHAVAVLYFDDLSPNGEGKMLSQFVSETLIDRLSGAAVLLDVRPRQVVGQFRGEDVTPDSMARALRADLLVDGSVTVADGLVRVVVELLDAEGNLIDSHALTWNTLAYIPLTDSIVDHVADALRREMGVHVEQRRLRAEARDEGAHAALLQARQIRDELPEAEDEAMQALARADSVLAWAARRDPSWAAIGLERARVNEDRFGLKLHRDSAAAAAWLDTAIVHTDRLLRGGRRNADALEMRARLRDLFTFTTSDLNALRQYRALAMADLAEATRIEPDRHEALGLLAQLLYSDGRFDAAIRVAQRARAADTFLQHERSNLYYEAMSEFERGHETRAASLCDEARRKYPANHQLAYCALTVMAFSDSIPADPDSAWTIAVAPLANGHGDQPQPMMEMLVAGVLAKAGLPDSANAILDRARVRPSTSEAGIWIEPAVRFRIGQTSAAEAGIDRLIQFVQGDPRIMNSRALRHVMADRRGEAARR